MSQLWSLIIRVVAEDIGIEPNTLTGTSRLAGGPYRHQGLSSIECGTTAVVEVPTQVIPLFVFTTGYDPITFCVSDKRSTNWATWTIRYFSRDEPNCHFLLDILWSTYYSSYRYHWGPQHCIFADKEGLEPSTTRLTVEGSAIELLVLLWERRDSNPQVLTETDLQSAEPTNCSTLPFLYTLQGSNLWPVVCKTTATTIWAKSAYCVPDRARTCDSLIKSEVL